MELPKTEVNTKDLAPLKFPKIHPEEAVREYLHSKAFNSVIKKCPEWDVARNDPNGELVLQKRELYNAEVRLENKKVKAIKQREEINKLWSDLEEKENTLRSNFIKFNRFVKENQEKRERAERKSTEAHGIFEKRETEIEDLESRYKIMSEVKATMERNIKDHLMYENFLLRVTKAYPMFRTYESILDRYEALAEARKVLADRQEEDLNTLEEAKVMGLYNLMADLQVRYEAAKSKALQWETMVARINNTLKSKLEELQDVRQASWTLYLAMCSRKEIESTLSEDDVENQLLFIKTTMGELKRITRIAQRRANRGCLGKSETVSSNRK
ncbi:hypothetical protein RI129_012393 [Pyrocoelia pectoralis]|uniref:DUF4200 domain-containing protein n=1 Tax=Pyrocoelia pectoralis TaxID=417401 RepID=A0AAN7UZ73_9COLE